MDALELKSLQYKYAVAMDALLEIAGHDGKFSDLSASEHADMALEMINKAERRLGLQKSYRLNVEKT